MFSIIDKGIDRNILVFDGMAPNAVFTKKLLYTMIMIDPQIQKIYISRECFVEFVPDSWWGPECNIEMFGKTIIFTQKLSSGILKNGERINAGIYYDYFDKRGASLSPGDTELIIAHGNQSHIVLLGSC